MSEMNRRFIVVGSVNVDIKAKIEGEVYWGTSNPGSLSFSLGGVGFNVACGLAKLGANVIFVTSFGGEMFGDYVASRIGSCLSSVVNLPADTTGVYLGVLSREGETLVGVAGDIPIYHLDFERFREVLPALSPEDVFVMDGNLSSRGIEYLRGIYSENFQVFVPASAPKLRSIVKSVSGMRLAVVNTKEYEMLSRGGALFETLVVTSRGEVRVYRWAQLDFVREIPRFHEVVDDTGAGDAFAAGFIYAYLGLGRQISDAVDFAVRHAWSVLKTDASQ